MPPGSFPPRAVNFFFFLQRRPARPRSAERRRKEAHAAARTPANLNAHEMALKKSKEATKGKSVKITEAGTEGAGKRRISVNWGRSTMTLNKLQLYEAGGLIPKDCGWRLPGKEEVPKPRSGEVVVFCDHVTRGFKPPGSKFFREMLAHYGLRLHDFGPNSMLNISNFHVMCEDYLEMEPDLDLWLEWFYCNSQREYTGGPLLQCGAVALQRRANCIFPKLALSSRNTDWQLSYFYCKDKSPPSEKPLPAFDNTTLELTPKLTAKGNPEARSKIEGWLQKTNALLAHGLIRLNLVRCWVGWRIQPVSLRTWLIHEYSSLITDDLRCSKDELEEDAIQLIVRKLTNEKLAVHELVGLEPFCALNKPYQVTYKCFLLASAYYNSHVLNCSSVITSFQQNDPSWWEARIEPIDPAESDQG